MPPPTSAGLYLAGDLGHITAFAERTTSKASLTSKLSSSHAIPTVESTARGVREWVPVADREAPAAFSASLLVTFHTLVPIPSNSLRRFYVRACEPVPLPGVAARADAATATHPAATYRLIGEMRMECSAACASKRGGSANQRTASASDGTLTISRACSHIDTKHLLMGEHEETDYQDNSLIGPYLPAGGLAYYKLDAAADDVRGALAAAQRRIDERLTSLCALLPSIDPPNIALIGACARSNLEVPPRQHHRSGT